MSVVDDFVEDAIRRFPRMYRSRGDVMHHVFAVLGNGYEWRDGVPYESARDVPGYVPYPYASLELYEAEALKSDYYGDERENLLAAAERWDEASSVLGRLDEAVRDYSFSFETGVDRTLGGSFYPEHGYALMRNVPADVHPDWLVEVRVMREAAEAYGWSFVDVV